MLAGYSSTLLSPRHRLRSEAAAAQFPVCHFPSMSTQRLDLPCSFARKDTPRTQSIRPVGITVEKHHEAKSSSCSLMQNASTATTAFVECKRESKDQFWEEKKSLKRFSEQVLHDDADDDDDEACMKKAKRKRGNENSDDSAEEERKLILDHLGSEDFWTGPGFNVPQSLPFLTGFDPPQLPFSFSCSGEEEHVGFVPREVMRPPLPLSNNPWVESVVTEITEFGEKDVETSWGPAKEASGSSASLESQGSDQCQNGSPQEHETGNGSRPPNHPREVADVVTGQNETDNHREYEGFELINLLVGCVEAIGSKNIASINQYIARLGNLASPRGSAVSRLTAYFTEALALRVARLWPQIFHISPPRELDDDYSTTLRFLNQVSPIPRFLHFTANEILLRALEEKDRVHIIDFDIKHGLQWPSLFQSLASRSNPPSHVRITGIGDSKQELIETGERLAGFAETLNLPFEFHPVVDRLEDVRLWMLHVKDKESVAVNCVFQMHKMLYDSTEGVLKDFLELIRSTNPIILVMAEQEAEHNEDSLEARLANSLRYYSAIFDSLDESVPQDNLMRLKIEEMFAREIKNIIACEGPERFERHQGFMKWRRMMEQGGFRGLEISERELLQSQMLLKMYGVGKSYQVEKQDAAALTLSWNDQPLYTVTAWEALDVAGSSLAQ